MRPRAVSTTFRPVIVARASPFMVRKGRRIKCVLTGLKFGLFHGH